MFHLPGAIPTLAHCGRWSAAGGCGSVGPEDSDFGHVRVGLGTQCLSTRLVPPELGPVEELDPVTSIELRRLIRNRSMVPDLPVALALKGFAAVTVRGDSAAARDLLRAVISQLAVLHSPDHLRIMAVVDPLTAPGLGLAEMAATSSTSARASTTVAGTHDVRQPRLRRDRACRR